MIMTLFHAMRAATTTVSWRLCCSLKANESGGNALQDVNVGEHDDGEDDHVMRMFMVMMLRLVLTKVMMTATMMPR